MTRVVFYKSNDSFYGFDLEGHTGLAESGEDILCAAISAMTMFVINAIEDTYCAPVTYTVDEKHAKITLTSTGAFPKDADDKIAFAVSGLIGAYFKQLKALEEEYQGFLHVTAKEKAVK